MPSYFQHKHNPFVLCWKDDRNNDLINLKIFSHWNTLVPQSTTLTFIAEIITIWAKYQHNFKKKRPWCSVTTRKRDESESQNFPGLPGNSYWHITDIRGRWIQREFGWSFFLLIFLFSDSVDFPVCFWYVRLRKSWQNYDHSPMKGAFS